MKDDDKSKVEHGEKLLDWHLEGAKTWYDNGGVANQENQTNKPAMIGAHQISVADIL